MKKKNNIPHQHPSAQYPAAELVHIHLAQLVAGNNPRSYFDEQALSQLAESFKQVGVIQPITVRKAHNSENTYSIICGERRYRAAQQAGLATIPAYIRQCSDAEALDMALTENLQREDMSELEVGEAIKQLYEQKKLSLSDIASTLGKSEKYVRDRYRLNKLIDPFKQLLTAHTLAMGKAVFLSSYPQDLQELIFKDHFTHEHYNFWAELSQKRFQDMLDTTYNSNLDTARFDTSACQHCPYNSNFGMLFTDETARCLNKKCFVKKDQSATYQNITSRLEAHPGYKICTGFYVPETLINDLETHGFELSDERATVYPAAPDQPSEPMIEDFTSEATGETDQDRFEAATTEYKEHVSTYSQAFKEYQEVIQTIDSKIQTGEYESCFILNGTEVEKGYIKHESQNNESHQKELPKSEIERLQKQLVREQELKIEKTISEIKSTHFKGSVDFENEPLKEEQNIVFFYLINELSAEHKERFFGGNIYPTDQQKYDFILTMKKEDQFVILRDYMLSHMRKTAYNAYSVSSQLFLAFSTLHFPQETYKIECKHQLVYMQREKKIKEKLVDLGVTLHEDKTTAEGEERVNGEQDPVTE